MIEHRKEKIPLYYPYPFYLTQGMPVRYPPPPIQGPFQPWHHSRLYRQFSEVNTQQLEISAHRFQELMKQANLLVNKIANSKQFAHALMFAAQQSDEKTVNELIKSTGVTIDIKTTFTPTGIRIVLDNTEKPGDCCDLLIALRW